MFPLSGSRFAFYKKKCAVEESHTSLVRGEAVEAEAPADETDMSDACHGPSHGISWGKTVRRCVQQVHAERRQEVAALEASGTEL